MTYQVSWDGPSAEEPGRGHQVDVDTVADLGGVLDRVAIQAAAENVPFAVQVHDPAASGSIMLGVGRPERSFVDWLVPDGRHEHGYQPDTTPPAEPIGFDVYGGWHEHPTHKLRVTPNTARQAAREYVRTGRRPTCLRWSSQ